MTLSGRWRQYVGDRLLREVDVPSSYRPLGVSRLVRTLPAVDVGEGEHLEIVTDGVANEATVSVESAVIGGFAGFTRDQVVLGEGRGLRGGEELSIEVRDLATALGDTGGWECYGGLIRDIRLVRLPALHLRDAWVRTLDADVPGSRAKLRLSCSIGSALAPGAPMSLTADVIAAGGRLVARAERCFDATGPVTDLELDLNAGDVAFWSPEHPHLHHCSLTLADASGVVCDHLDLSFGVRMFGVEGTRFVLNGEPVFLYGVCRHDMWKDRGYTLTPAQTRRDLEMIKATGANFVRLVHYPHNPHVLDVCDEIGLLVTEEPGIWGDEQTDPRHAEESALEVLGLSALRDRGHPSLAGWVLGNESGVSTQYLRRGRELLARLDPGRPLAFSDIRGEGSGAKSPALCKVRNDKWGADFYSYHPYAPPQKAVHACREAIAVLNGKPLLFGEWGGAPVQRDTVLMGDLGALFADAADVPGNGPHRLAGVSFWEWADMRQYGRGAPFCRDGVLEEGLVGEDRTPKADLPLMQGVFSAIRGGRRMEDATKAYAGFEYPARLPSNAAGVRGLVGPDGSEAAERQEKAWRVTDPHYTPWPEPPGSLRGLVGLRSHGMPYLLCEQCRLLDVKVSGDVSEIWVLGLAGLDDAYPIGRPLGEVAARMDVVGADDEVLTTQLRHGREIARENSIYRGSRIEPVATEAVTLCTYSPDPERESRVLRLWRAMLPDRRRVEHLRFEWVPGGCPVLLQGLGLT